MAKKSVKLKVTKAVDAPYELPNGTALREVFDTDETALTNRKLQEIAALLWHGEGATEEDITVCRMSLRTDPVLSPRFDPLLIMY
jgi:hypothetical protein